MGVWVRLALISAFLMSCTAQKTIEGETQQASLRRAQSECDHDHDRRRPAGAFNPDSGTSAADNGGNDGGDQSGGDNGSPYTRFKSVQSSVNETNGSFSHHVEVQINNRPFNQNITVPVIVGSGSAAMSPEDFEISNSSVTFSPGGPRIKNLTVTINGDTAQENSELLVLNIDAANLVGAQPFSNNQSHRVTINDDDDSDSGEPGDGGGNNGGGNPPGCMAGDTANNSGSTPNVPGYDHVSLGPNAADKNILYVHRSQRTPDNNGNMNTVNSWFLKGKQRASDGKTRVYVHGGGYATGNPGNSRTPEIDADEMVEIIEKCMELPLDQVALVYINPHGHADHGHCQHYSIMDQRIGIEAIYFHRNGYNGSSWRSSLVSSMGGCTSTFNSLAQPIGVSGGSCSTEGDLFAFEAANGDQWNVFDEMSRHGESHIGIRTGLAIVNQTKGFFIFGTNANETNNPSSCPQPNMPKLPSHGIITYSR